MKLHYADYGRDQSRTLIILHGLLGSERNWHSLARRFETSMHVLAPDLRNHGASPHHPVHTVKAMRTDLEEFVDEHALDRFFLMGHSMGGHVAMDYAFHNPGHLQGLIVEDIAPRAYGSGLTGILSAMMELDLSLFQGKSQVDAALAAKVPDSIVRHFLLTNLARHDRHLTWRANLTALMDYVQNDVAKFRADDLARYEGPTLFIGGQLSSVDLSGEEQLILKHFPNARVEMVENADHWVHFDAKDLFSSMVLEFIRACVR